MLLNCDLGESYGSWTMGLDAEVMPHIDQANIACGFHGGDPLTIGNTLALAGAHRVQIGAHPAYPDLVGFGRRPMHLSADEIIANVHYQVAALDGMAQSRQQTVSYVKPHGALYNDMMARSEVRAAIMQAVASYHRSLSLMLQATLHADLHRREAESFGIVLIFEGFADRCYDDDGALLSRRLPGAVHSRQRMLDQVAQLCEDASVTTANGNVISLQVDTLCVHGDNAEGVQAIEAIRSLVDAS